MQINLFFEYLFNLCLVIVTFTFLWGIFKLIYKLIRANSKTNVTETYAIILIQYIVLIDVVMVFWNGFPKGNKFISLWISGVFLLIYFLSQVRSRKMRSNFLKIAIQGLPQVKSPYDRNSELMVLGISMSFFLFLVFKPSFASNGISLWFNQSIESISITPVFGWVFKLIGFFMMTFMLVGIPGLIRSLTAKVNDKSENSWQSRDSSDFDDYEEINDDQRNLR